MVVQYCSDLHLEFKENAKWLNQHPIQPVGDVLLLAGDIVPFMEMDGQGRFFDFLAENFELTIWVPGNHEYYYADASERTGSFIEKVRENVLLVNNSTVRHKGVRFVCATLWTEIGPANQWQIQRAMSDFRLIRYNSKPFTTVEYNLLHAVSKTFIGNELAQNRDTPTVVLTHHIPTFMHYPEKYKGDVLNEAFAVELYDMIEVSGVKYWVYGHHHCKVADFVIGTTHLVNNQLGYVQRNEHREFDVGKTFNVA